MSSSMLSPTNPAYRFDPPKGGILLNAIRPQQSVPKSPSSTSYTTPSSPSSSDSASGSDDPAPKVQSNRRITFAPLPKPRAQDDVPVIVFDHTSDKLYEDPEPANSSSGDDNPAFILDPTTRSPQLGAKKPSTWSHSTKKLLKPFYKPLQKSDTADGGALGLFRSSSRDSTASSVGTLNDTPLARRMSTGSSPFDIGRTNQDRSGLALHPVTSENGGVATGTRMLNGRVYGGSRYRTAVQKKEVEKDPEFVEWGYGGMGSNRGSSASSTYAKVQSSHTNAVAAEDDDDGSGMGWVRKRREAREKEKREREEREAKEREAAPGAATAAPEPAAAETANTAAAGDAQSANPTQDDSSTTAHSDPVSPPTDAPEHITQAVHIPFGHHHHHHHPHAKPSPSRRSSDMASGGSTPIVKPNNDSTPTVTSIPHSTVPSVGSSLWMSATPEHAQSSEDSESDEESTEREDEAREDDDEDEEEESEDDANLRKTSVCAGVEKISRHKE